MNLNYSYRAFLVTCLLFAIFFLALYSWKLGKGQEPFNPKYDIEYAETDPLLEEEQELEELALSEEKTTIETNRAYNEAEQFLKKGTTTTEEFEQKLAEMDAAITEGSTNTSKAAIQAAKEKLKETYETSLKEDPNNTEKSAGSNRKTTIRYSLKDRKALHLPNPVYTCEAGGLIVISIEVSSLGKVTKATYNKGLSNTTNGCLIYSALEYANKARFNTKAVKPSQLGTISYIFPGQN